MTTIVILFRIILSTILGGVIGFEREVHGCAAGLRTHILVCIGSSLFMITSVLVAVKYGIAGSADPTRIAAQVVTGIGFLGAGAIIRYGASIRGLTTAASIWAVSAIGLSVGAGLYEAALITTIVVITVLILSRVEERMNLRKYGEKLNISLKPGSLVNRQEIRKIIDTYGGRIKRSAHIQDSENRVIRITYDMILARTYHEELTSEIGAVEGVEKVWWTKPRS
ncbi:MAG: MgtC/SapB family protein [Candidatus Omnitrophota bacterium]